MEDQVRKMTCIVCPNGCRLTVRVQGDAIMVEGATCKKGETFAKEELTHPMRNISSTVATVFPDFPRLAVKTRDPIPKEKIFEAMARINAVTVQKALHTGDVVVPDVFGTDIVATQDIPQD